MVVIGGVVVTVLIVLFPLDWAKVPSVTVMAEQSAFSPNDDSEQDTFTVVYSLSEEASVAIEVLDETRTVVRQITEDEKKAAGQHTITWDGRSDTGAVVADGQYHVRIQAKGTARSSAGNAPILVDTQPPIIRLANMPEDIKVREEELLIEGETEPNVTLWFNNRPQPVPVDRGGGFSLRHPLREGPNRLELTVVDQAGNRSSAVREVTLILKPPEIVITVPSEGLWINQKMLSVQGRVPPGTTLLVNDKEAQVNAEGDFSVDVLLQEGENQIQLEATDEVGNVTTTRRQVFLKTQPPSLVLSSVKERMTVREPSFLVVGRTEAGATVTLNGRDLAVDSRGGFQGLVNLVEGENLVQAEAVDQAGNTTTLTHRITYASPSASPNTPPLPVVLPIVLTGAGVSLGLWLLMGGWIRPISLSLYTNSPIVYPNRESSETILSLKLSRPAWVTVNVWDQQGDLVANLIHRRRRGGGEHFLVWDGRDSHAQTVSNGVYEIEASASTLTTAVSSSVQMQVDTSVAYLPARQQQWQETRKTSGSTTVSG